MILDEFYNIDNLKNRIQDFRNKSYLNCSIEEIIIQLQSFYNVYNNMVANYGNTVVFRVRKFNGIENHETPKSVWAPPATDVIKVGRSNNIGESIFYASFDPLTSIIEGRIQEGDEFTLAIYHLHPLEDWNMSSVVISTPRKGVMQNKKIDKYSLLLNEFMIEEFTKKVNDGNEDEYKVSCAISKILLSIPYKDSIIYPSIQNENNVNIAMIEEKAKTRMELLSVLKCKMINKNANGQANVEISEYANPHSKKFEEKFDFISTPLINYIMPITSSTWIKNKITFEEVFNYKNITQPSEILKQVLKKNN